MTIQDTTKNIGQAIRMLCIMTGVSTFFLSCEKVDGKATPPSFVQNEFQLTNDAQSIVLHAKNDVNWFMSDLTIHGTLA